MFLFTSGRKIFLSFSFDLIFEYAYFVTRYTNNAIRNLEVDVVKGRRVVPWEILKCSRVFSWVSYWIECYLYLVLFEKRKYNITAVVINRAFHARKDMSKHV